VVNRGYGKHKADVETAKGFIVHTLCMALAFVALILVAIAIEFFSRYLIQIQWIEPNHYIYWSLYFGSRSLAVIDVLGLVSVVGKKMWKKIKAA
jgi:hypothetical protein